MAQASSLWKTLPSPHTPHPTPIRGEAGTCGPGFPKNQLVAQASRLRKVMVALSDSEPSDEQEEKVQEKMREKKLDCWEDFETEVSLIFTVLENRRKETPFEVSSPLFRGHAKESWKLKTTLERYSNKDYSITDYYRILRSIEPAVASFTSKKWNFDPALKIDESDYGPPPRYDFMVYLRHHGFPSPLLDWSRSPYVAAFFAFQPRPEEEDDNVAIYSYVEYYGSGKGGNIQQAQIIGLGPYVHTHKRHFIQQCQYTICKRYDEDRYIYSNHEEAFQRNETRQDILTKYLIPRSERPKVLSKLDFMNINSYSLFLTEESLMETLAYQEIERINR